MPQKARRPHSKLTQEELTNSLSSSQSQVAKMAAGDPSVSVDLLIRSLLALGADNQTIAKVIAARWNGDSDTRFCIPLPTPINDINPFSPFAAIVSHGERVHL